MTVQFNQTNNNAGNVNNTMPQKPDPRLPQKGKRLRILRVSGELLRQLLLLPENARILDVSNHLFFLNDQFALKVECPDFSPVESDEQVPTVEAVYDQIRTPRFIGWSL